MKRIIILLFTFFCSLGGKADPYNLFEENGRIGIKDQQGNILIPAAFEALGWSDGSFSIVGQITGYKLKDGWGLINLKKEFLTKADYKTIIYPGGDRVIVTKQINPAQIKTGCLSLNGEVKIPFKYDAITIAGLRAIVAIRKGTNYNFGLVDLEDRELVNAQYKSIRALGTLRFAIENWKGKVALFSEQGKLITDFKIDSISAFKGNMAIFHQDLKQGLMNRDGEIKIEPHYREIRIINEDVFGRMPTEWKLLDRDNQELNKIEADELIPHNHQRYTITKSGRFGVVDSNFTEILPLEYDYLSYANKNQFIAKKNNHYGLIGQNNSVLLPFAFDTLIAHGNLLRVREKEFGRTGWAIYDTFGIKKTVRSYDMIDPYNGKFFPVQSLGYVGAVNRYGEEFIHCVYDSITDFADEQIAVKFKGLYGIISIREEWLVEPQLHPLKLLNDERYLQVEGKMIFLKDFQGTVIYFTDNQITPIENYLLEVLPDGIEKVIDYNGRIQSRTIGPMDEHIDELMSVSEGLRGFKKDGKYGFIDERGRLRIANRYEAIQSFKEGMAAVKLNAKWGYINATEKLIIQPTYDDAGEFQNGVTIVKRANQFGILEKDGKLVQPIRYDSIIRLPSGSFLILTKSQQGLVSTGGQVLIEPKYDNITDLENSTLIVERDGKSGLLSLDGVSTIPMIYDRLIYLRETNLYLSKKNADWKKVDLK